MFFVDWLKLAIKPLPSPTERGENTKKETRRSVGESRGVARMA